MKNKNGFTLVELLAVIVIMGILMMVAIPSITRTIENSRKDAFVDIAKSYGNAVRTLWTSDNLTCSGTVSSAVDDGDYYILINSKEDAKDSLPIILDQGGKLSWGNRDVNGYVRVSISTTAGEDDAGDGSFEVEPKRVTKYYVALSDGTHGIIDDNTLTMDELKRGNINMNLTTTDLKRIEFTFDDGRLNCVKTASGLYACVSVLPVNNITSICTDDLNSVSHIGNLNINPVSFATDDWSTISGALKTGIHPYRVGDTKTIDMGTFGTHTVRIANLTPCDNTLGSQTACGVVIEFADIIYRYNMNPSGEYKGVTYSAGWNVDGWPASDMRAFLNNDIYKSLPIELQSAMIPTTVVSGYGGNDHSNFISTDKMYLLSPSEIFAPGTANNIVYDTAIDSTRQLDYYRDKAVTTSSYSEALKTYNGSSSFWWLRSATSHHNTYFYGVHVEGKPGFVGAYFARGISPAFRLA